MRTVSFREGKYPYKWANGIVTPISGVVVLTLLITGFLGPTFVSGEWWDAGGNEKGKSLIGFNKKK